MGRLQDKVAVITGAAGGIGRESAILFAKEGAKLVITDVNDAGGEATAEAIRAFSKDVVYLHADVSKAEDNERTIALAEQTYGAVHVLFNNAGIMHGELPGVSAALHRILLACGVRCHRARTRRLF